MLSVERLVGPFRKNTGVDRKSEQLLLRELIPTTLNSADKELLSGFGGSLQEEKA